MLSAEVTLSSSIPDHPRAWAKQRAVLGKAGVAVFVSSPLLFREKWVFAD